MRVGVTGVGSLPHADPTEAAEFVLRSTTIPYLPQLPGRHPEEGMVRQWGDGLCSCGAVEDGYGLGYGTPPGPLEERFVGAETALDRLLPGDHVKTQATGPVTLGLAMLAGGHPREGLWSCLVPALVDAIEAHLGAVRSHAASAEITLVLDEPALGAFATPPPARVPVDRAEAGEVLRAVIESVSVRPGIHCCAETDWTWIVGFAPAAVSWDVLTLSAGFPDPEPLAAGFATGMLPMWGVVPAVPSPVSLANAVPAVFRTVVTELVVAGAPVDALIGGWYTPSCGLAGVSVAQAEWVMDMVAAVATRLAG